jgi:hypothetical protein
MIFLLLVCVAVTSLVVYYSPVSDLYISLLYLRVSNTWAFFFFFIGLVHPWSDGFLKKLKHHHCQKEAYSHEQT